MQQRPSSRPAAPTPKTHVHRCHNLWGRLLRGRQRVHPAKQVVLHLLDQHLVVRCRHAAHAARLVRRQHQRAAAGICGRAAHGSGCDVPPRRGCCEHTTSQHTKVLSTGRRRVQAQYMPASPSHSHSPAGRPASASCSGDSCSPAQPSRAAQLTTSRCAPSTARTSGLSTSEANHSRSRSVHTCVAAAAPCRWASS